MKRTNLNEIQRKRKESHNNWTPLKENESPPKHQKKYQFFLSLQMTGKYAQVQIDLPWKVDIAEKMDKGYPGHSRKFGHRLPLGIAENIGHSLP